MRYDIFFSICQTPVEGFEPSEAEMFQNFFRQVEAADAQGYGTAWVAEAHLSTQIQKRHAAPVVPHWQGEIGLNTDIFQLAHRVFGRTKRIGVGSAVMNLLCNGGPIARAEQIAAFLSLHGLDPAEARRLNIGFSAGRFEFMNRAYGHSPRADWEAAAWPVVKGLIFAEACEIFLRLLRGDVLSSEDIRPRSLSRTDFRSDADWAKVRDLAGQDTVEVPNWYRFEPLQIIPRRWRRELLELYLGSHAPWLQEEVQRHYPVRIFNLSITAPNIIEDTHRRLAAAFHPDGGAWDRGCMPRTVMVFLNATPGLSPSEQRAAAQEEARVALSAYWQALEGTLDPKKIAEATDNAVVGNPEDVAQQVASRFHPDDRLMLWFDFFNHNCDRIIANQEAFLSDVAPRVARLQGRSL